MKTIYKFAVVPSLPEPLKRLRELASNMWWCWNFDAIELFIRLDRNLWEETAHNPVALLGRVSQERLEFLANDRAFMHSLNAVLDRFDNAMSNGRVFKNLEGDSSNFLVAYFSLEFGLHESLPVYSGGLGVLAGDHLKSSSDIGLPLVAVGLLYREGYFRQYLNADGWQQETYPDNDFYNMPIVPLFDEDGNPQKLHVNLHDRSVSVRLWKVQVGRIPLILLDTNLEENSLDDREITAQLYGGDLEMRLKQEYILGLGGVDALKKLGFNPTVFHMNEGHSAFLGLKRIKDLMKNRGLTFWEAMEACSSGSLFTTHTPVPAGIDKFPPALMDKYFWKYREETGISRDDFLGLGREDPSNHDEPFSLAVLALRLSDRYNGVSKLHGEVSRKMWRKVWPEIPVDEIPINHVTNGIHNKTWVSHELGNLFDRYLGPRWAEYTEDADLWGAVDQIPDAELWKTHERRRERLVGFVRKRMKQQFEKRGASKTEMNLADEVLNPDILTIGFARRFATYKRATLIFSDLVRLARIITDTERPVQFIFAGKAHPKDNEGKEFIRKIIHIIRKEPFRHSVVFLEDYDMNVARYMLQGVDVWLNNPRRPLEASGTSGMKASANGAMNLSVLDGWWCEGYTPDTGYSIGRGEEYTDLALQDDVEYRALYDLIEKEIVHDFYTRGRDGIPRTWVSRMKSIFKEVVPVFNTNRMVMEYANKFYIPAHSRWNMMRSGDYNGARNLTAWKGKVKANWHEVKIVKVETASHENVKVGETIGVKVEVTLGHLSPKDVSAQVLFGSLNPDGELVTPQVRDLSVSETRENITVYEGTISCHNSGMQGLAVRLLPSNEALSYLHETGLIRWA
ncbi:alpha-glucan family phosphorylase [Myxococcota bacterium]|nr:alpha-glucan family phosphorylase [Myxococcota bacterium]MBU1380120.1 alpha-glucan family phosphorylase [Myxococcota bacterium]MBU1497142.1 alpha-glucan family phosphorylase [Myxococcota bacterium]